MAPPPDSKQEAIAAPMSTTQQGDNIAHALAGAGGGLLSMTLTSVISTLSSIDQAQNYEFNISDTAYSYPLITLSTRAQVESKRAQTSTIAAIQHIIRREGLSGLYSGLSSALFGISVTNFVYYYCKPVPLLPTPAID